MNIIMDSSIEGMFKVCGARIFQHNSFSIIIMKNLDKPLIK
jgi:hypothetical protein